MWIYNRTPVNSYFCTVIPLIKLLFSIESKFPATFFPIKFFFHGRGGFTWQQGKGVDDFYFPLKIQTVVLEAVVQRCSVKNVFLEISQNSQENTFPPVFSCEFCKISEDSFSYRTIIHDKNLDQKSSLLISRKFQKRYNWHSLCLAKVLHICHLNHHGYSHCDCANS